MNLFSLVKFIVRHPMNAGRPIAAVTRFAKWQLGSRLLPAALFNFVDDKVMVVSKGMTGLTGNIYCGLHEHEEMGFALHLLRPGNLFVDVGANVGSYTVLASAAGADVIAFEPGERYPDLLRNVAVNHLPADCRRQAVGAENDVLRFTRGRDTMNRIAQAGEESVEVPVVRLDDAIGRPPTLIKIDVEGFEGAVLAGGGKTIGQAEAVIMELAGQGARFGYDENAIRAGMAAMGFAPFGYNPFTRTLIPAHDRPNTIFVRGDVSGRLSSAPTFRVTGRSI